MAASETPLPPSWPQGAAPTVAERNAYDRYLFAEIRIRDLKHERLTHHVAAHCQ